MGEKEEKSRSRIIMEFLIKIAITIALTWSSFAKGGNIIEGIILFEVMYLVVSFLLFFVNLYGGFGAIFLGFFAGGWVYLVLALAIPAAIVGVMFYILPTRVAGVLGLVGAAAFFIKDILDVIEAVKPGAFDSFSFRNIGAPRDEYGNKILGIPIIGLNGRRQIIVLGTLVTIVATVVYSLVANPTGPKGLKAEDMQVAYSDENNDGETPKRRRRASAEDYEEKIDSTSEKRGRRPRIDNEEENSDGVTEKRGRRSLAKEDEKNIYGNNDINDEGGLDRASDKDDEKAIDRADTKDDEEALSGASDEEADTEVAKEAEPAEEAEDTEETTDVFRAKDDKIYYEFEYSKEGKYATISSYKGNMEVLEIPDEINGNIVTGIGARVFAGNEYIKEVVFPDTLDTIGEGAFEKCTQLAKVYFGGSSKSRAKIDVEDGNEVLDKAEWIYNYSNVDRPSTNEETDESMDIARANESKKDKKGSDDESKQFDEAETLRNRKETPDASKGATDYEDIDGDYVLPFSNSRYVTEDDLKGLSKEELRIARNEIYARKGYIFKSPELVKYFEGKSWYKGTVKADDFTSGLLNQYELENGRFILEYENRQ